MRGVLNAAYASLGNLSFDDRIGVVTDALVVQVRALHNLGMRSR